MKNRLAEMIKQRAMKWGEFTLSSGATSNYYVDMKKITLSPDGLSLICELIAQNTRNLEYDCWAGMAIGADPIIGGMVSYQHKSARSGLIIRPNIKDHGTRKRIEGPLYKAGIDPLRAVIVEDVTTTGKTLYDCYKYLRSEGVETVAMLSILDRSGGEAVSQIQRWLDSEGLAVPPLIALVTQDDIVPRRHYEVYVQLPDAVPSQSQTSVFDGLEEAQAHARSLATKYNGKYAVHLVSVVRTEMDPCPGLPAR